MLVFCTEIFRLPLDPTVELTGLDVKACGVFSSNFAPLRLTFNNRDPMGKIYFWALMIKQLRASDDKSYAMVRLTRALHSRLQANR